MSLTEYTMGSSAAPRSEAEFQKLSQTIATSIQKMLQNGKYLETFDYFDVKSNFCSYRLINFSLDNATNGQSNRNSARFTRS